MEVLAGEPDFVVDLVCIQVTHIMIRHGHIKGDFNSTPNYRASPIAVSASTSPKCTGIHAYIQNMNVL